VHLLVEGNFNFHYICVLRVAKGCINLLFFMTSYKNSEFKCVNVTASNTSSSLKLLQKVRLKKKVNFESLPISKRKSDDLQSSTNNKILLI
jgi:hypothetical protein